MNRIILLTVMLFAVSIGFSKSQVTGTQKGKVQFSDAVKKIESKFDVSVTYETDIAFELTKKQLDDVLKMSTAEKALRRATKSQKVSVTKIRDDYYVLKRMVSANLPTSDIIVPSGTKEKVITGLVQEENGNPIPGATVMVVGTTIATFTDMNGKFTLSVPDDMNVLQISYIGFQDYQLTLTDETNYTVTLAEDVFGLDEVVVSGVAGTTSTKKLTVTVEKVGEDELKDVPAASAAGALQGKIAGMQVKQSYGTPGSGATIRLRGSTSLTGNQSPLIIVDGVMTETNLSNFNVDDIESYEVVKGAAAASLYGSRAGNGVIVITTKRGKNLKESFKVKVRNEYGISELQKELDLATHHPYQLAADDADYPYTKYEGVIYDDDGNIVMGSRLLTADEYADQPYAVLHDQQSEFFKQGDYYTNYISLAKKEEKTNMFLSFENHKNSGIVFATEGYKRNNFRFNADTRVGEYLKISTSNLYIKAGTDNPGTSKGFSDVLFVNPDVDLTAPAADGTPYNVLPDPWSIAENPLYPLYYRESTSDKNSFLSNITVKLTPNQWFYVDAKYTYERGNTQDYGYNPMGYEYMGNAYIDGLLSKSNYNSVSQIFQSTINFDRIYGDITVKAKGSYLLENLDYNYFSVVGKGFIIPDIPNFNNIDQTQLSAYSYEGETKTMNMFGILDMDYQDTYLFSGLYRYDVSSLFGANVRWNPYYRIAAAYRITEDITIPNVQELKIRGAIGTSGQRPGFSNQYETYSIGNGFASKEQLGNADLKPSESREIEVALDAQFLKIMSLKLSYSVTDTKDAIDVVPLASHLGGFTSQWRNIGTINSEAYELSLGIRALNKKDTKLNFNLTFDKITQSITQLDVPEYQTGPASAYYIQEGQPFGILYGYQWLTSLDQMANQLPENMSIDDYTINSDGYVILNGTEGTIAEAPIKLDENNDGVADKVIIADGNPDFNLNLSARFSYKSISFYMLWSYTQGGAIYNYTRQYLLRDGRAIEADQYGKADSEKKAISYYSALYDGSNLNSHFVEDGTFLKLREASVYYNLKIKDNKYIKGLRFGVVGRNLLTFTDYSGYDPEVASGSDLTNYSFDNFGYPVFRTATVSLELTF